MAVVLTGVLVIAVAVALPLLPAFGEGGARRDVVLYAAELARAERAGPSSLSKNATIMDRDGKELRKGTNGWTCMPDNAYFDPQLGAQHEFGAKIGRAHV